MKQILKSTPPKEFILWYNNRIPPPTIWDHLNSSDKKTLDRGDFDYSKNKLRSYLFKEQKAICAYCNQRIENDYTSKIEHFLPKKIYIKETFNYYNLILSCDGNSKRKSDKKYHCDNLKGDTEIKINPTKREYLNELVYDEFGNIFSNNQTCESDIITLGLNCPTLVNRRKQIFEGIVFDLDGNYYKSYYYRFVLIKSIVKPIEFKDQTQYVLLNLMNDFDRTICIGLLKVVNILHRFSQIISIFRNAKYYKYKMK